ncbi:GNAT family N-acetyltransferase [Vogesella mureinivorans]|jgi:ElaA protein|uniref:GNAT family N-acetyltransferase n=1 Tax=Vogesella mureinivorans TaxID=657276 RepID=UPI0011CA38C6|nr:GNAT family N-acetyltransferase [Vogesella mureinivorans]
MPNPLQWQCHGFTDFTPHDLYQVLQLRDQVFVVEQQSIYGDIDGIDLDCWHLSARDASGRLVAYARLVAPGVKYPDATAIGRVVIPPYARGSGLAKPLMQQAVQQCEQLFPGRAIMLSAQQDKLGFYEQFGFHSVSAPYDDGGILHVDMRRG